ncbi:hypothetical protein ACFL3J_00090 [Candidatus Omnitrophota bacterium]
MFSNKNRYFGINKTWFRVVAVTLACIFFFNNISYALSPPTKFHSDISIEEKNSILFLTENTGNKSSPIGFFNENIAFAYLSRIIAGTLERYGSGSITAETLKEIIELHLPQYLKNKQFERFKWDELYKDGETFCVPYEMDTPSEERPFLRYYLAEDNPPEAAGKISMPIGKARMICEGREIDSLERDMELPPGSPYTIFIEELLPRKGSFVSARKIAKKTGLSLQHTVLRDLGVLHFLGLAEKDGKGDEAMFSAADISPPQLEIIKPILESLGTRPTSLQKEDAKIRLAARMFALKLEGVDILRTFASDRTPEEARAESKIANLDVEILLLDLIDLPWGSREYLLTVRALSFNRNLISYVKARRVYPELENMPEKRRDLSFILRCIQHSTVYFENEYNRTHGPHYITRRTWTGRSDASFVLIEKELARFKRTHPRKKFVIGDFAVSDGTSSLELARRLKDKNVKIIASDKMLNIWIAQLGLNGEGTVFAVLDQWGNLLQIVSEETNERTSAENLDPEWRSSIEDYFKGLLTSDNEEDREGILHVSLINPEAEEFAMQNPELLEFRTHDVFSASEQKYHFIRVLGLLMRGSIGYFNDNAIKNALKNLGKSLVSGGAILSGAFWGTGGAYDFYRKTGKSLVRNPSYSSGYVDGYEDAKFWKRISLSVLNGNDSESNKVKQVRRKVASLNGEISSETTLMLQNYYSVLNNLSCLSSDRVYEGYGSYDFPSNEANYINAVETRGSVAIKDKGGAYIGTGIEQNFAHIIHQNAEVGIIVDKNAAVTEVILPALGILISRAKNRVDFLSTLFSRSITEKDRQALNTDPELNINSVGAVEFFRRKDVNNAMLERTINEVAGLILPHIDAANRGDAKEILSEFFNTCADSNASINFWRETAWKENEEGLGSWLSSEENFKDLRKRWQEKKIVGVIGDFRSSEIEKVADYLNRKNLSVGCIYVSNIEGWFSLFIQHGGIDAADTDPERFISVIENLNLFYSNMENLPLKEDAVVISDTRGSPNYALPFSEFVKCRIGHIPQECNRILKYKILLAKDMRKIFGMMRRDGGPEDGLKNFTEYAYDVGALEDRRYNAMGSVLSDLSGYYASHKGKSGDLFKMNEQKLKGFVESIARDRGIALVDFEVDRVLWLSRNLALIDDKTDFDPEREAASADNFINTLIARIEKEAITAKKEGKYIIIGIETSWIPELQQAGMQKLLNKLSHLSRKRGLDNIIIRRRKKGTDLAKVLLEDVNNTGTPLSRVVVLGDKAVLRSKVFDKLEGAFFAEVELPENFPANGHTRLLEKLAIAVKRSSGKKTRSANISVRQDPNNPRRVTLKLKKIETFKLDDLRSIHDVQANRLDRSA